MSKLNDPLFTDSEYSYNRDLAISSFNLAVSAFSSNVTDTNWGNSNQSGREDNVRKKLIEYGFSNIYFYDYDKSLNDYSSKAAFAVGSKHYNHDTIIVAVAVRGGNYGLEWADNFNIGNSSNDYHIGFYNAALNIKSTLDKLVIPLAKQKNIKFWITGYSRGGAVANILASMYDKNKTDFPCQVYAYTFASPKTSIISSVSAHDTIYRNIFNILSPNDPLYNIPPEKWGFGRFGICVVFPDNNDLSYEGASEINRRVAKSYYTYTGETLVTSKANINSFVDIIIKSSQSRDFFSDNLSTPISELIMVKMMRYKDDKGIWQHYNLNDILEKLHGKNAVSLMKTIRQNPFFTSLKNIGINLPDDFYTFVTLCSLNGFSGYENILFSNIKADDMNNLSYISSQDMIYTGHRYEFYRAWLENAPILVMKFVKE